MTDSTTDPIPNPRSSGSATPPADSRGLWSAVILPTLGSMNLAILLLLFLAIASVVGSVLQQNQPYENYVAKFGSFWFQVYQNLGLYDVYSAGWFVAILIFLCASVSICIYRNAPTMLRDVRRWRDDVTAKSLVRMRQSDVLIQDGQLLDTKASAIDVCRDTIARAGYRCRVTDSEGNALVSAKRGGANRYGYIATHLAIVVICVGGLMDSKFGLLYDEMQGTLDIERRVIPASQVGDRSRVSVNAFTFRGQVNIPEGSQADFIFLNVRDGYVIQQLPFSVEVKEFRVEHYDTGQPKSFETDLVIHDDELDEPIAHTIAVNHPVTHRGVTIYQASFQDGGSKLTFRMWPLGENAEVVEVESNVGKTETLNVGGQRYSLELDDFRKFNVIDVAKNQVRPDFSNIGSSVTFKLRGPDGKALEYHNYMSPIVVDEQLYYLSGVRSTPAEEFDYIHLPVGKQGNIERFTGLLARLRDRDELKRLAAGLADGAQTGESVDLDDKTLALLTMFANQGFNGIEEFVEGNVPEDQRKNVFDAYFNVIRVAMARLYSDQLASEGADMNAAWDEDDTRFLADFMSAVSALSAYGPPVYLQLTGFDHREASGLEMTKSPGKPIVFLGSTLLCVGVFLLFYINPRRVWALVRDDGAVIVSGANHRKVPGFDEELDAIKNKIAQQLGMVIEKH